MTGMIKPRHGTNLESRVEEQEQSTTIFDPIFAWISRRPFLRQVRFAPFFLAPENREEEEEEEEEVPSKRSEFYYSGRGKKKKIASCRRRFVPISITILLPSPGVFLSSPSSPVYLNFKFENLNSTPPSSHLSIHFLSL